MKNPSFTDKILSFLPLLLHDFLLFSSFLISQPLILAYLLLLFPYLLKLIFFLFPLLFSTFLLLALLNATFYLHESPSSSAIINFFRAELIADDANGDFIAQLCSMIFVESQHFCYKVGADCNSGNQREKIVALSQNCNLLEDIAIKEKKSEILSEKTEEKSCSEHFCYQVGPDCNSGNQSEKIVALSQSCNLLDDFSIKENRIEILSEKTEEKSCSEHFCYQVGPDCNSDNQSKKIVALSQSCNLFEDFATKKCRTEILSEKTEEKSCSEHFCYQVGSDCNSGNQRKKIVALSQCYNLLEDFATKKCRTEILSEKTEEKSCSGHRDLEEIENNTKNMVFIDSKHSSYQMEPNEDFNSGNQSEKIVALSQSCNLFEDSTTKKNITKILCEKTEENSCPEHKTIEDKDNNNKNIFFVDSQHNSYQIKPNEGHNSNNHSEKIPSLSPSCNIFEDSTTKRNKVEILSKKTSDKNHPDQQKHEEKEINTKTILQRRNEHIRRPSEIFQRENSIKKEKEWKRTLACKIFEERMTYKLCEERKVVNGAEEMDFLWEAYEVNAVKTEKQNKEKNTEKKKVKNAEEEEDDDEDEEKGISGQLCCLQALKFSTGKMNLGIGRPSFVKISMALKGMAVFQRAGRRRKITN